MPVAPTYPGVYIEEIPSGVRTITGVATSIAAFVGRARRGPVNEAIVINSFGDYERVFGGLWIDSTMSYAVSDFFRNGGAQAVIVRLFHHDAAANPAAVDKVALTASGVTLDAAYEGRWGENLRIRLDGQVSDQAASALNLAKTDLFNLNVVELASDGTPARSETFRNLTVKPSARRIDNVLKAESELVQWNGSWPPATLPDIPALHAAEATLAGATTPAAIASAEQALLAINTDAVSKATLDLAAAKKTLSDALAAHPSTDPVVVAAQLDVNTKTTALATATDAAKASDGIDLVKADFTPPNGETDKHGLFALAKADIFNILCLPPYTLGGDIDASLVADAAVYCEKRRAMFVIDPPSTWNTTAKAIAGVTNIGTNSKNSALYFPRLNKPNPLRDDQLEEFVPCGAVAGIYARTDTTRGVWKAPAGLDATLVGVPKLSVQLNDAENGQLNPLGINCLRAMVPAGRIVWGARTLQGDDRLASEWKYVPVRRTALYIEESLFRGTQWVVFEPNDEPLWAQIRLNVGSFMHDLFRQGAFQGSTPKDAYFVKCDKETTTQSDINHGIVNIVVGFAPLKPAEFVIIKLQQIAGSIDV
ncbi:MAG TPA: phage tail sheath C-terminal domain-containing protein [Thermoanaerobaculia bacterium]|jgi:phage tail sheath protein FI|nr:phage tail sheath C-terminal domain-containing protein [Thermoanaerobaculia bacterium]